LVFAFHSPLPSDKKNYAAQALMTLMVGGMSSRLFNEIREKRNLAYAIKGVYEGEKDYAYSLVYAGTTPEKVEEVKALIIKEFEKASKDLEEKELAQVKEQIIGNYLITQEDSHNVLLDLIIAEIRGNARDAEKFVDNIKSVKLKEVKELAKIKAYSFFALIPEPLFQHWLILPAHTPRRAGHLPIATGPF